MPDMMPKIGEANRVNKILEETQKADVNESKANTEKEDLSAPYTDTRSVTIALVQQYSAYREANMKVLGQRTGTIGSSVTSTRILSSNKGEVEAYFPQLIGLSPNNPDFVTRVKAYLSNIQFVVNNSDVKLDVSFEYNHKSDYLACQAQEDAINAEYDKVDRTDIKAIKDAIRRRVEKLNALESTKYKFGHPINLEHYIIYRHCLLYREVAKDIALINEDSSLRFYIKDEAREAIKAKKLVNERKNALKLFIELGASEIKFNAVYIQICRLKNVILSEALLKAKDEREKVLMDYANENPDKFNKIANDKNVITKAFINTLIARGELVQAEFNQQISTVDGTFIGSNMNEAVAYFNDPNNAAVKTAYENKLKLI